MTSFLIRGRPRRATAHIRVRVAHALLGVVTGTVWLVLPLMTVGAPDAVPAARAGTTARSAPPRPEGTSTADLVLPLLAGVAAVALAGYGRLRRVRRARTRTTPGTVPARPSAPSPEDAERQARAALRLADDCVRTSGEELTFVRERFGAGRTERFERALRAAETESAAAFAIWRRYEQGAPREAGARRQALAGVTGRCAEAGRRLDAEAEALDRLRGFGERGLDPAGLEVAEGRSRELTARVAAARETLAELRARYPASASESVAGYAEQAGDRLLFATARLDEARRAADAGDTGRAVCRLRAGEGAVAQAGVLVGGVERLAARLAEAAMLVPDALAAAETEATAARGGAARAAREEWAAGTGDPLDLLRRITRAARPVPGAGSGALERAALLVARCSVEGAEEYVSVHRAAVGTAARARLAEAVRELGAGHAGRADVVAGEARELAGLDVRTHGRPYADVEGDTAGLPGAVLGGILLAEDADAGPPASYGGPRTRSRHRA
ncbi:MULTISPECIES: hypothetical protein [Streptomyces]|uniref:hypothetical protein n=1 Tax=Streptomyces TaxID=1883 RepID=UPI00167BDEC8|nr:MULTISPECIES: hypothetical protein [Streptomyces]MBK3524153.1 hypothetical protein [Streptomyces sp. MBT70]GGR55338.1 hypothetical protein GCM10010236_04390 [Streptomyces eurythermus]